METEVSKKLDDIHDFLVNNLASIPVSVFDDLKYLEDRIAELERCVVMGGDGKPIAVGDEMKTRRGKLITVQSIRKDHQTGQYYIYDGFGFRSAKSLKQVSSPDSVPEVEGGGS